MGLDQYLKGEIYISQDRYKDGTHSDNPEYKIISSLFGLKDLVSKDSHTGIEITFPVGYWRKANQIHNWFVQNIQNGNDNCGNYYVSRENLETLKVYVLKSYLKKTMIPLRNYCQMVRVSSLGERALTNGILKVLKRLSRYFQDV